MLKICVIFFLIQQSVLAVKTVSSNSVEQFMDKLQNKQIHEAKLILKNVNETNALYQISLKLLTLRSPLIVLMFFTTITDENYNWHHYLEIVQDVQLWQALKSNLDLLRFEKIKAFLKALEDSVVQKSAVQLKLFIIHKNFEGFEKLTQQLSTLSLELLFQTLQLSVTKTYGLILHSKLLKRLNLFGNLNKTKVIYFIVFFKELKAQKAVTASLAYKLALSLRYLMHTFCDQEFYLQFTNLKQALPSNILLLVFSKKLCLSHQAQELWYLSSLKETPFNLSLSATDSTAFASYAVQHKQHKLILKAKSSNLEIFINYNHNSSDNFYDYHLQPVTANAYILLSATTNQMLCFKNSETFWLNALKSGKTNCLWTLNNCTSLKRFLTNEI